MKRKIKLIITDIDGTIAKADNSISDNVKNMFKKLSQNGIKIVVASGRMLSAAKIMAQRLNLDTPLVAYQGAVIQYPNESKPLFANYVDKECATRIVKYLKQKNIHTQLYNNNEILSEYDNDLVKAYAQKMETGYRVVKDFEELDLGATPKILAIDNNAEIISQIYKETSMIFKDKMCITLSTPYFCEFTNPKGHKGEALKILAKYYDIPLEQTMAFGDQKNDITMIKTAGIGVAVGNADEDLKLASDFVTKSIDEDGVVYAIEKFVDFGV